MDLSVHRCSHDLQGLRVERYRRAPEVPGGEREPSERDWVATRQCPELARWVAQVEALELAPGASRPLEDLGQPAAGTWYTLSGRTATGGGLLGRIEVEVRQPEGAALNALSAWIEEGESVFQHCRDSGRGDARWLPPRRGR